MAKILEPLVGRQTAAGILSPAAKGDYSQMYQDDAYPADEPGRSEALKTMLNDTIMVRLRSDMAPDLQKTFRRPTKAEAAAGGKGSPYVCKTDWRFDRRSRKMVPGRVINFYPGVSVSVAGEVAIALLSGEHGPYIEEADGDDAPPTSD